MKKKQRALSLVLALLLAFSLVACGTTVDPTEAPTEAPTEVPLVFPTEPVTAEDPIDHIFLCLNGPSDWEMITIWNQYDGTAYVEFADGEKRSGTLDAIMLHNMDALLEETALLSLAGQERVTEGGAEAFMSIGFSDGTQISANYYGSIPQEFMDGYDHIKATVEQLTADFPAHVPTVNTEDCTDAVAGAAVTEILNKVNFYDHDCYFVRDVPMDDRFCWTMGLSTSEGIASGVMCDLDPFYKPFGIYLVTLEEGTDWAAVATDFEANMDWLRYCSMYIDKALIAQRDNMVFLLVSPEYWYEPAKAAVEAAGWTVVKEMERPAES